jgi:hypothetical protein
MSGNTKKNNLRVNDKWVNSALSISWS